MTMVYAHLCDDARRDANRVIDRLVGQAVSEASAEPVGLLSDAAESTVNLVAAIGALFALRIAARPADETHHYGHTKAEFFSAAAEGTMIFVAAAFIIWSAIQRIIEPQPLENVGIGLIGLVALAIRLTGRRRAR